MFRRFGTTVAARMAAPLMATASNTQARTYNNQQQQDNRATSTYSSSTTTTNTPTTPRFNGKQLPPSFDVISFNNDDISQGYLGRVSLEEGHVVFSRRQQVRASTSHDDHKVNHFDKANVINVPLGTGMYTRVQAVLEGYADHAEISTRSTKGKFLPDEDPHSYKLQCETRLEGLPPVEWVMNFDAPHALMLNRFISEALKHAQGFGSFLSNVPEYKHAAKQAHVHRR